MLCRRTADPGTAKAREDWLGDDALALNGIKLAAVECLFEEGELRIFSAVLQPKRAAFNMASQWVRIDPDCELSKTIHAVRDASTGTGQFYHRLVRDHGSWAYACLSAYGGKQAEAVGFVHQEFPGRRCDRAACEEAARYAQSMMPSHTAQAAGADGTVTFTPGRDQADPLDYTVHLRTAAVALVDTIHHITQTCSSLSEADLERRLIFPVAATAFSRLQFLRVCVVFSL
jgi:hypothetical protein